MAIPKCSRCSNQIGKNFIWLQKENLLLHKKCHKLYLIDMRNKEFYKRRKNNLFRPFGGMTQ